MSLSHRFDPQALDLLEQRLLQERQKRQAKKSLIEWCRWCGSEPARHHQLFLRHLEDVIAGKIDRLMMFAPPGSAKSFYASRLFPAYYMGLFPSHAVIAASHTAELARKWGRHVRNLIAEHGTMLGVHLASDSMAADRW